MFARLGYQIATKHRVPIEILGHAMQAYNKTMYAYGDEAPCYSSPRMLEEALGVDLRCYGGMAISVKIYFYKYNFKV